MAAMGGPGGADAVPVAEAVQLYPDGREEPIRGAMLAGISPASFKNIIAASRTRAVATTGMGRGGGMAFAMSLLPRSFFRHLMVGQQATYVVPSLLLDDVSIRKPTGDGVAPPAYGPPWISK